MRTFHYLPALALALALALVPALAPVSGFLPSASAAHDGGHGGGHGGSHETTGGTSGGTMGGTSGGTMGGTPAASAAVYSAKGTITRVEKAEGRVILRHEAIPAVRWPAMTMTFRLEDPAAADGLKQGDAVRFDFRNDGPTPTIVHIEPLD
jgi:Cu/Ag efflux protein CusF